LNEEITRENTQLLSSAQSIDNKATFVAGVAAAALPFLLANRRGLLWAVALVLYLAGLVLAVIALWPRRWSGLVPADLQTRLSGAEPVFAVGRVAGTKVGVFERNYAKARWKMIQWVASILALGGGTIMLVLSTIFEKGQHG